LAGSSLAETKPEKLTVTNRTFANNQQIPASFTCQGIDASPALKFANPRGRRLNRNRAPGTP
jgi:phosphatidylethanolamine-binding protein (PEBP) family uncharacterized protein